MRPGLPAGKIRPETQTFVSTTTRSVRPSDLANGLHHVSLDLLGGPAALTRQLRTSLEELTEAATPLVFRDWPDVLRRQPGIDGLADQACDRLGPPLRHAAQRVYLLLREIDVRPLHRLYTIHLGAGGFPRRPHLCPWGQIAGVSSKIDTYMSLATQMKGGSYRAVFERDESGAWIARVPSMRGCHTHGRSLEQARRRLREALGLWVSDADTAGLVEEIRLPLGASRAIRESRKRRVRADESRAHAQKATRQAARTLVEELHLGLRDAAELLGLSHQRVQQLIRSGSHERHESRPGSFYAPVPGRKNLWVLYRPLNGDEFVITVTPRPRESRSRR